MAKNNLPLIFGLIAAVFIGGALLFLVLPQMGLGAVVGDGTGGVATETGGLVCTDDQKISVTWDRPV